MLGQKHNVHFGVFARFVDLDLFAHQVFVLAYREDKVRGIEVIHEIVALAAVVDSPQLHALAVYILNFQVVIYDHDSVGAVHDNLVGHTLRALPDVGQTHFHVRKAVGNRPRLLPASVVSARAAVQLVLRSEFARFGKNGFDFALGHKQIGIVQGVMVAA